MCRDSLTTLYLSLLILQIRTLNLNYAIYMCGDSLTTLYLSLLILQIYTLNLNYAVYIYIT